MDWIWVNVGLTYSEPNGTTSIQRSDSGSSVIQWFLQPCFSRPKQLLLLFTYRDLWATLRSESYGTASIQYSDSEGTSTQLATASKWFESLGISTQFSESEFSSILRV